MAALDTFAKAFIQAAAANDGSMLKVQAALEGVRADRRKENERISKLDEAYEQRYNGPRQGIAMARRTFEARLLTDAGSSPSSLLDAVLHRPIGVPSNVFTKYNLE